MTRILTIVITALFAHQAQAQCTCIYAEGTVKEGETACIWSEKGKILARCEKVQNVTSWKLLDQSCPVEQSEMPTPEAHKG
jgi:Zn finger protein HypA/HybF involved in hydrogenase expression